MKTLALLFLAIMIFALQTSPVLAVGKMAELAYKEGKKLKRKRDLEGAEKMFLTALKECPNHVPSLFSLAELYGKMKKPGGQMDLLIKLKEELEKRDTKDKERKKYYGKTAKQLKKLMKNFEEVEKIVKEYAQELTDLGVKEFKRQNFVNAIRSFERVRALDPDNKTIVELYEEAGKMQWIRGVKLLSRLNHTKWKRFTNADWNFEENKLSSTTTNMGVDGIFYQEEVPRNFKVGLDLTFGKKMRNYPNPLSASFLFNFDAEGGHRHYMVTFTRSQILVAEYAKRRLAIEKTITLEDSLEEGKTYSFIVVLSGNKVDVMLKGKAMLSCELTKNIIHNRVGLSLAGGHITFANMIFKEHKE